MLIEFLKRLAKQQVQLIVVWLLTPMSTPILASVSSCTTAHGIWNTLKPLYGSTFEESASIGQERSEADERVPVGASSYSEHSGHIGDVIEDDDLVIEETNMSSLFKMSRAGTQL